MDGDRHLDIFVGGGGDDLSILGLGVVRALAAAHAARTGRRVRYAPNGRVGRLVAMVAAARAQGDIVSLIGHSYGGPDAWRAVQIAAAAGHPAQALITLDAVSGPLAVLKYRRGRRPERRFPGGWLDVQASPVSRRLSNRLPHLAPFAVKPAGLPFDQADRRVHVVADHADVEAMMRLSGAGAWLGWDG